jgi:hypothetical protein
MVGLCEAPSSGQEVMHLTCHFSFHVFLSFGKEEVKETCQFFFYFLHKSKAIIVALLLDLVLSCHYTYNLTCGSWSGLVLHTGIVSSDMSYECKSFVH